MRFYKVAFWSEMESSQGFEYYTTIRDADMAKQKYDTPDGLRRATISSFDVSPSKAGILDALREHGSHKDNG